MRGFGLRFLRGLGRGALAALFGLALWRAVVWLTGAPPFILPPPEQVLAILWTQAPMIADHAGVTVRAILLGLAAGAALGAATALNLALSPLARRLMRPALVFLQATPIFALAPVLTLWLGYGLGAKVAIVALIVYFPVASAFFDGLTRTPQGLLDLAQVMGASDRRLLLALRLPYALPALGSGLRLAAVQAPLGAVLGEWAGASQGLGYLMLIANGRAQTGLMFASLIVLACVAVALHAAADRGCAALARRYGGAAG